MKSKTYFPIESYTIEELRELKKLISKELESKRSVSTKDSLLIFKQLRDIGLYNRLVNECPEIKEPYLTKESYISHEVLQNQVEGSIYKLCDIVLGNYTFKDIKKNLPGGLKVDSAQFRRNGFDISQDMIDEYREMSSEILEIIRKHFKK